MFLNTIICKGTSRPARAVEHFVRALELDPLQWRAYEELCGLGAEKEVSGLLQEQGGGLLFGSGVDTGVGAEAGAGGLLAGGQATPKPGGEALWVHEEEEENVDPLQASGTGAGGGGMGGDAASTPYYATPQVSVGAGGHGPRGGGTGASVGDACGGCGGCGGCGLDRRVGVCCVLTRPMNIAILERRRPQSVTGAKSP